MPVEVSKYDFELPHELIAQFPAEKREDSRLLVVDRKKESFEEYKFKDIVGIIPRDYFLVLNNTKVIKCRLFPKKQTGGRVEIFLLEHINGDLFKGMVRGRVRVGEVLLFDENRYCKIISTTEDNFKIIEIENYNYIIDKYGHIPLPPYIKREDLPLDYERYQTVYASRGSSVAAPTAGLHFTEKLLSHIKEKHKVFEITLNVGLGTFRPIKTSYIEDHIMHEESYFIDESVAEEINTLKRQGKKLLAVGSTTVRALESASESHQIVRWGMLKTDIFIKPGYDFKIVDAILTNFHLPKSTLFIMVCTFGGEKLMRQAYEYAIKNRFRFFSYGDAMLIV